MFRTLKLLPRVTEIALQRVQLPARTTVSHRLASSFTDKLSMLFDKSLTPKLQIKRLVSLSPRTPLAESLAGLPIKKRPTKKKVNLDLDTDKGYYSVNAFATAEEYDLERLRESIIQENLYAVKPLPRTVNQIGSISTPQDDYLYVTAKILIGEESREIFFFREGSVVLWNCTELECSNVLAHLKNFEIDSYDRHLADEESDVMAYNYIKDRAKLANGNFYLSKTRDQSLERYTFSNAMSASVKLGIWEAVLDRYVDSMAYVTEDLKRGNKIKMTRAEVLRKTGELFALRHQINLSSDLLDIPDFYWDREALEVLYSSSCSFFSLQKRTKVMNEKLNHCVELADLVATNLNDIHHVRLEWMIIILIMVEVAFEMLHVVDRFM